MDPRIFGLQRELEGAREQVAYCLRGLKQFNRDADEADPHTPCARAKLEGDLRLAEQDAAWAEVNLSDVTSPAEVAHLREADKCQAAS